MLPIDWRGVTVKWAENPLASTVTLDDYGRLRLRYGIAVEAVADAAVCINMDKKEAAPQGGKWVDTFEFLGHEDDVLPAIERRSKDYERWLLDPHDGDCICVPCSCCKCHAEGMVGISTTPGLGKYAGSSVAAAFSLRHSSNAKTLAEALRWIRADLHWESESQPTKNREDAIAWLEAYGKEHGFAT